jgi:hypothetical protein
MLPHSLGATPRESKPHPFLYCAVDGLFFNGLELPRVLKLPLVLLLSLNVTLRESTTPPTLLLLWWWFSPSVLELGIVEFLVVVKPLSYCSFSFYSTFLPWFCLLLH